VHLFLLDCQHLWDKLCWDVFHVHIFFQNGLYQSK
jgi:hypothetical protein